MEVRKGYKRTDLGVIPEDWTDKFLSDFFVFKNGLNKEKKYFGYGTPIINYMDVFRTRALYAKDVKGKVFLKPEEIKTYDAKKGDVFFTRTSETVEEIGISSVLAENINNAVFSGFILRARPINDDLTNGYKKYCFSTHQVRKQICATSSYTTRALTNGKLLAEIKILVPFNKAEQNAIATALNDADALIHGLVALIAKKKAIKHGTMQVLLSGKKRLPGFGGEWEVKSLPEICWFQEGPGLRNWQFRNTGMKVINVTNLENGYLNLQRTDRYISLDEFHRMYEHFAIAAGDIVVASSGNSYGKVSVVRKKDLPLMMNTSVIRFKPLSGMDYNFLHQFLKSIYFKGQLDALITGGAQPNFGPAHLKKVTIQVPAKIEEQSAVSSILNDIDVEIIALKDKLAKYRQIKKGMMQELLTGKTRIT